MRTILKSSSKYDKDTKVTTYKLDQLDAALKFLHRRVNALDSEPIAAKSVQEELKVVPSEPEIVKKADDEPVVAEQASPLSEVKTILNQLDDIVKEDKEEKVLKSVPEASTGSSEISDEKQPTTSFFDRHPDLEKFIGENLINKIGIAILVLGIGFFIKYAIDKEWINEVGRLFIGILSGGVLIGIAHRLRKSFSAFSSVLVGGGLTVLYFSIAFAYYEYELLSQSLAFISMVIITAFAVFLSVAYDRKELAVIALIGGFSTPFLLSSGEGNYVVLFTYLLILNIGMLVLAYKRKWVLVNWLCYAFTVLIYGGWLMSKLGDSDAPYGGGFLFAVAFYVIFFVMNVHHNLANKLAFKAVDISILLSNTFLFFSAGISILNYWGDGYFQGLFTIALGALNCGVAFYLHKKSDLDKNLFFLLIGLVLTFVSLTIPIQLEGNYITIFWAAEFVLLFWLSIKSGMEIFKGASVLVFALTIVSLLMDWQNIYSQNQLLPIILNKAFITSSVVMIACLLLMKLMGKGANNELLFKTISPSAVYPIMRVLVIAVIYIACYLELKFQAQQRIENIDSQYILSALYNFVFASALLFYNSRFKVYKKPFVGFAIALLPVIMSIVFYNNRVIDVRNICFSDSTSATIFFWMHFIYAGLFIYLYREIVHSGALLLEEAKISRDLIYWFAVPVLLWFASSELDHLVVAIGVSAGGAIPEIVYQNHKIGYSLLWGLVSFVLMILGMRQKMRIKRILSLSLFSVVIAKLFIMDLRGLSEGGRILSFVILGIVLLVVSFMYQKLKKIIVDADEK